MPDTPRMTAAQEKEECESLKLIIEEQKRDYDYLIHIYSRMRAAENFLLTATYGVVAFLYFGTPNDGKLTIAQRFSIPSDDAKLVIYVIAGAFFLYGLVKLTLNVFGDSPWSTAYETPKNDYSHKQIDTLRYIKERYDKCYDFNKKTYYKHKGELRFLFYSVIISAIILIVIKTLK